MAPAYAYPPDWDDVPAPELEPPETPGVGRQRDHRAEWRKRRLRVYNKACELRDSLRARLGGVCSNPRCRSTRNLEFHHPYGRDWEPREKNLLQRMRLYARDFKAGRLVLLCSHCNAIDGGYRGYWQRKLKRASNKVQKNTR